MLREHFFPWAPTQKCYIEWSVSVEGVDSQISWFLYREVKNGIDVPIYVILVFQKQERLDIAAIDNGVFYEPHVLLAQCNTRTDRYPDARIISENASYKKSQLMKSSYHVLDIFRKGKSFILKYLRTTSEEHKNLFYTFWYTLSKTFF